MSLNDIHRNVLLQTVWTEVWSRSEQENEVCAGTKKNGMRPEDDSEEFVCLLAGSREQQSDCFKHEQKSFSLHEASTAQLLSGNIQIWSINCADKERQVIVVAPCDRALCHYRIESLTQSLQHYELHQSVRRPKVRGHDSLLIDQTNIPDMLHIVLHPVAVIDLRQRSEVVSCPKSNSSWSMKVGQSLPDNQQSVPTCSLLFNITEDIKTKT